jgi:REP element-mobilizing transposase RayT
MGKRITRQPPRYHDDFSIYFLTFCTYQRKPFLHEKDIHKLIISNLEYYGKRLTDLIAYTIMPDHIHLLVEVEKSGTISDFLRDFKKHTSKEITTHLNEKITHVWQRGTMDHCIRFSWTGKDFDNHLQYLFSNSWKHLQIPPKDFPYHNFKDIVKRGWLEEDFLVNVDPQFPLGKIYDP